MMHARRGKRTAILMESAVDYTRLRLLLHPCGWDDDITGQAWECTAPDTPHNRAHLRTLAIDWCAHGVSPCEARTPGGLPKRGAMGLEAAWQLPRGAMWLRLRDEREDVREVTP